MKKISIFGKHETCYRIMELKWNLNWYIEIKRRKKKKKKNEEKKG